MFGFFGAVLGMFPFFSWMNIWFFGFHGTLPFQILAMPSMYVMRYSLPLSQYLFGTTSTNALVFAFLIPVVVFFFLGLLLYKLVRCARALIAS
jgi:hypothetical protein